MGDVEIDDMNTGIDMNRIGRKVKAWGLVLKEGAMGAEMDPSIMRDAVTGLNTARRTREIKWPVNVGVAMGKINPAAKWGKIVASRIVLGRVRRLDEVSGRFRSRCHDIVDGVVLQPVSLVRRIEANVVVVECIELDDKAPIL